MATVEGSIVKKALRLSRRSRHSSLLYACDIDKTNTFINKMKLKAILRFLDNELTRGIVSCQVRKSQNKPVTRDSILAEITHNIGKKCPTIERLCKEVMNKLCELNNDTEAQRKDKIVTEIKKHLSSAKEADKQKLREILSLII